MQRKKKSNYNLLRIDVLIVDTTSYKLRSSIHHKRHKHCVQVKVLLRKKKFWIWLILLIIHHEHFLIKCAFPLNQYSFVAQTLLTILIIKCRLYLCWIKLSMFTDRLQQLFSFEKTNVLFLLFTHDKCRVNTRRIDRRTPLRHVSRSWSRETPSSMFD